MRGRSRDRPDVVLSPWALYTNDMKSVDRVHSARQFVLNTDFFRDCMIMAKSKVFQNLDARVDNQELH